MAILKKISGKNTSLRYIVMILNYISKGYKTMDGQYCGTRGCCNDDPARDFYSIKKAYHKTGGKQGEHFVLSLEANNKASYKECMTVGYEIADYFEDFQVAFALHKDTNNRHIHFVVNSVSYKDGHKFSQGPDDLNKFKTYCNKVLNNHNFDIVRMKTYEMCDNELYPINNGFGFIEAAENTPKSESEMNVIVPYEVDEYEKISSYEDSSYDEDFQNDYWDTHKIKKGKRKIKKLKKKLEKEAKGLNGGIKMGKKKYFVPEVIDKEDNNLQLDTQDFLNENMHIIAVDNSKKCNIKVKTKEQAAYLAGTLFTSADTNNDIQQGISDLCQAAGNGKTIRCIINNSKNLSIEIDDEQ